MKRSTLALFVALGLFAFLWVQVSAQPGTLRRPIVRTDRNTNLLFQDTFDDPASGWDTTASMAGAIIYQDGALVIISQREGDLMWSQLSRNFTDTLITVDAVQVSDPAHQNNAHGVACRVQPDGISAYTVLVSGAGAYAIVHTGANQGGTLVDWITSDAIHTGGESNHIAVTCAGNTIGLSINGVEVAKVVADTLEAGKIALLANSFDDNPLEVHFDNLKVSVAEAHPTAAARSLSIRPPVIEEAPPLQEADVVTISQELAAGILFRDDFADEDAVWNTSSDDNRSKYHENDEYIMEVKAAEWATWSWGTSDPFQDFTVETDVRMVDGPETARYGVFVRQVDNDNYLFILIDPHGYYKISRKQDGYWKAIPNSQRTFSSAILTGTATNRLKVVGEGEEVALFVNGQHLTTIRDDFPAAGRAGLVVETTSLPEPPAKVAFDNFRIAIPEAFPPVEETGKPGLLYSHDFNTQEDWTESFDDSRDRYYEDGEYVRHYID